MLDHFSRAASAARKDFAIGRCGFLWSSAARPSGASGPESRMKAITRPSLALPMRMPWRKRRAAVVHDGGCPRPGGVAANPQGSRRADGCDRRRVLRSPPAPAVGGARPLRTLCTHQAATGVSEILRRQRRRIPGSNGKDRDAMSTVGFHFLPERTQSESHWQPSVPQDGARFDGDDRARRVLRWS
jgi:hypothetical protein